MKSKLSNTLAIIYLALLFVDVVSLIGNFTAVHYWVKPLLMPVLAVYLISALRNTPFSGWFFPVAGIILAWAGDVFLLFEYVNPLYFLAGLGSFLATHIFYVLFFWKLAGKAKGWWKQQFLIWISVLIYGIVLVSALWPHLGAMKMPVAIYAACISIMVIFSLRMQPAMPKAVWVFFAIGAFLFFISDSILALNKFLQPIAWAAPLIMLTYGLAQYFIAKGTIRYFAAVSGEA